MIAKGKILRVNGIDDKLAWHFSDGFCKQNGFSETVAVDGIVEEFLDPDGIYSGINSVNRARSAT